MTEVDDRLKATGKALGSLQGKFGVLGRLLVGLFLLLWFFGSIVFCLMLLVFAVDGLRTHLMLFFVAYSFITGVVSIPFCIISPKRWWQSRWSWAFFVQAYIFMALYFVETVLSISILDYMR